MPIFDTYRFISQLTAAGVPQAQAEVHSAALVSLNEALFDRFPTKEEMKQDMTQMKQDVKLLSAELNGRMDRLEAHMHGELMLNRWMLGTVVTGIVALLIKSFS